MIPTKKGFLIERGDIFLLNLGSNENGREIDQPVLVIQNDIGNRFCNSIIVVPLFPNLQLKKVLLGVLLKAGNKTGLTLDHVALFTQIRTVDKSCFQRDKFLGRPDSGVMARVDEVIKLSLGLSTLQHIQTKQMQLIQKQRKGRAE